MPDQNENRLIVVGALAGAHGVRGDVRVRSFTDDPASLFELGPLLDEQGKPVLEPKRAKPGNDHFIVTPAQPRQKEDWDAMKGVKLHVRRSALPPPDEDEFYVEDLTGLVVRDTGGARIGSVRSVQDFGAGDLIEVQPDGTGTPSYFVPFTLVDVPQIDFSAGHVVIADPAGWADQSDPRKTQEGEGEGEGEGD